MLSNYFKIAFRNLLKHKIFSAINIVGLGIGMAVCMLILLYVSHELSFDRFHQKADRIFSARMHLKMGETELQMNRFAPDFAAKVKEANPEILESVRFAASVRGSTPVKSEEGRQFMESRFFFADPSILRVFSFRFLQGDPQKALDGPMNVVISDAMAKKYFGEADPIGKPLLYNKKEQLLVSGVFEKMPSNSSLQFDFIATTAMYESMLRRENPKLGDDLGYIYQTWFLTDNPAAKGKIEKTIPALMPKSDDTIISNSTYALSPLTAMHLGNNWGDFSNSKYISVFVLVAALVLFLALFNYMNLTTARVAVRAREVGVRKVLGAHRGQLGKQFYSESVLVSALGFVLGWSIFALARPAFCQLLGLQIEEQFLYSAFFVGTMVGLFLLAALIAGSYPALILSRFSPVQILKGHLAPKQSGVNVRRVLIVLQFAVSMALIVFSIGIRQQLSFMQTQNIGMNREQVMVVPVTKGAGSHFPAFKQEIRDLTGVKKVSAASLALFQGGWNMYFVKTPTTKEDIGINAMAIDAHFFETLEIEWKIPPANPSDLASRHQLLLNESGVERLKMSDRPIGQRLDMESGSSEIVGVTKDFNFSSLQQKIEGMLFEVVDDTVSLAGAGGHLYIRLDPKADLDEKVATIGRLFKKYEADAPFDFYFLDEAFNNQYRAEKRMGYLFSGFTGVALLLACLGLLGLVTFSAEQRTKEIGIRKVLGASVAGITGLLAKDFLTLVLLAIVIASPIAYYIMQKWLSNFAYRVDIQWWMFAGAGVAAVLIAFLTVGFQAMKAALANPVRSLRSE